MTKLTLSLLALLFAVPAMAVEEEPDFFKDLPTYEVKLKPKSARSELEMSRTQISLEEVDSQFPSMADKSVVIHLSGVVFGGHCESDQLMVTTKRSARGNYPEETIVHTVNLQQLSAPTANGFNLDGMMCAGGMAAKFKVDLLVEITGKGSLEKTKQWEFLIPDTQKTKIVKVDYDFNKKKWSYRLE